MLKLLPRSTLLATASVAGSLLCGCSEEHAAEMQLPSAEVTVYKAEPGAVEIKDLLPGRVVAYRTAEIRPQVSGIVQKRLFEQGSEVKEGQVLFQLNAAPFKAEENSARAALARAEATIERARTQAERLKPLIDADAISRQSYDDAVSAQRQAEADVMAARAALERRQLDVAFAAISSPISGRVDQAIMTEGTLATAAESSPMAIVHQIDPVFIDVRQPAARLDKIREAISSGNGDETGEVDIFLPSGAPYPVKGRLLFSGINVDPATGDILVRVVVSNPDRLLLPGLYVQAALPRIRAKKVITVPQQAVAHMPGGDAQVMVVDPAGKVTPLAVKTGDVHEGWYVILSGLKGGENVIVEGQDRVMPDAPVKATPWRSATGIDAVPETRAPAHDDEETP